MTLILIGPRAAGKTTIGKAISEIVESPFVDLDNEFEVANRVSIGTYVENHPFGIAGFRPEETKALERVHSRYSGQEIILALGGGTLVHDDGEQYRKRNLELCNQMNGQFLYLIPYLDLQKSIPILVERIRNDTTIRPSITGKSLDADVEEMLYRRHPRYMNIADRNLLETDLHSIEHAASKAVELYKSPRK